MAHPKYTLRQVAKTMESFGTRIQFSVFECPLDDLRLEKLKAALHDLIHHENDQILFVSLGPEDSSHGLRIDSMVTPVCGSMWTPALARFVRLAFVSVAIAPCMVLQ